MSRNSLHVGENIIVEYGNDHAIGRFVDVIDLRFQDHQDDHQGEGFVAEWSTLFGIDQGRNRIGITATEMQLLFSDLTAFKQVVIHKCDKFAATLAPRIPKAKFCVHCGEHKDPSSTSHCDMGYHQDCNFYQFEKDSQRYAIPDDIVIDPENDQFLPDGRDDVGYGERDDEIDPF